MNTNKLVITDYASNSFPDLAEVYRSAFSESPWDEYKKCNSCNINYGKNECLSPQSICKKCEEPLKLVDFWSDTDIKSDIDYAFSQRSPIFFVGRIEGIMQGFIWGYDLPLDKFPFLNGVVNPQTNYIDDIAVRAEARKKGIGRLLGEYYLNVLNKDSILRTDARNVASMALFSSLGFKETGVSDPEFENRIYLFRKNV